MNKDDIQPLQNRILSLFSDSSDVALSVLLEDCCSEISRLVASWIQNQDKSNHVFILKGTNVLNTQKSHDILAIISPNQDVFIIDPTIWQFFPNKQSILINVFKDIDEGLIEIKKLYNGIWSISEELDRISPVEQTKYKEVISEIVKENLHNNT